MEFSWQQSRSEALYVEQESKQIYGFIAWKDDNRMKIEAHYCGPTAGGAPTCQCPLGFFADEKVAKSAVEKQAQNVLHSGPQTEKRLVTENVKEIAASLVDGLEKQVVGSHAKK